MHNQVHDLTEKLSGQRTPRWPPRQVVGWGELPHREPQH